MNTHSVRILWRPWIGHGLFSWAPYVSVDKVASTSLRQVILHSYRVDWVVLASRHCCSDANVRIIPELAWQILELLGLYLIDGPPNWNRPYFEGPEEISREVTSDMCRPSWCNHIACQKAENVGKANVRPRRGKNFLH